MVNHVWIYWRPLNVRCLIPKSHTLPLSSTTWPCFIFRLVTKQWRDVFGSRSKVKRVSVLLSASFCQSTKWCPPPKGRMDRRCPYWRPTRHTRPWRISNRRASMWLRHHVSDGIHVMENHTAFKVPSRSLPVGQVLTLCTILGTTTRFT